MTATFDHMDMHDLVDLLTAEEQQELRPVLLRLVSNHARWAEESPAAQSSTSRPALSFEGTVHAGPDFASTSQETLRRELGGHE